MESPVMALWKEQHALELCASMPVPVDSDSTRRAPRLSAIMKEELDLNPDDLAGTFATLEDSRRTAEHNGKVVQILRFVSLSGRFVV